MRSKNTATLSGADVRAERNRYGIKQAQLAAELGWYANIMPSVENDRIPLSQEGYQMMLDAVLRLAARRAKERKGK